MVWNLLKNLMREERVTFLVKKQPTKANGCYTRHLLALAGPWEDLKVPACGKGISIRRSFCTGSGLNWGFLEPSSPVMYAAGVRTTNISHFVEGMYGAFYSRLSALTTGKVEAWPKKPLGRSTTRDSWTGTY